MQKKRNLCTHQQNGSLGHVKGNGISGKGVRFLYGIAITLFVLFNKYPSFEIFNHS